MARRATNGEGTVYQRKDGRHEGRAFFLTTSGKYKARSFYGKTDKEARDKMTAALAQAQRGTPIPDKTWKLGPYLDYWLAEHVTPNKRPKTYEQYEAAVRLRIKPHLGHLPLTKLTVPIVQHTLNTLRADGSSARVVEVVRTTLSAALTRAMREEILMRNVARLVEIPKSIPAEVEPWTTEEARTYLAAAKKHVLYAALLIPLLYGLRLGEVLGLRWSDFDTERNIMRVRQQVQRVRRQLIILPVKTRSGSRDLPLLEVLSDAIVSYKSYRDRVANGSELAFTTDTGQPIEPKNFVRTFKRICKSADLRPIDFHHQRHTASTLLAELGVPPKVAQKILGHAHISTTMQIYTHSRRPQEQKAVSLMVAVLFEQENNHADEERGLSSLVGSGYRQDLPSTSSFVDLCRWIISGGPTGTRTQDTLLKRQIHASCIARATEVKMSYQRATRRRMLGAVTVNLAVKPHTSAPQKT